MIKGKVKEQGFAWNGLESWREMHEADLLADQGRIQAESLKPFREWLQETEAGTQIKFQSHQKGQTSNRTEQQLRQEKFKLPCVTSGDFENCLTSCQSTAAGSLENPPMCREKKINKASCHTGSCKQPPSSYPTVSGTFRTKPNKIS